VGRGDAHPAYPVIKPPLAVSIKKENKGYRKSECPNHNLISLHVSFIASERICERLHKIKRYRGQPTFSCKDGNGCQISEKKSCSENVLVCSNKLCMRGGIGNKDIELYSRSWRERNRVTERETGEVCLRKRDRMQDGESDTGRVRNTESKCEREVERRQHIDIIKAHNRLLHLARLFVPECKQCNFQLATVGIT
jgi:hypothetical protein